MLRLWIVTTLLCAVHAQDEFGAAGKRIVQLASDTQDILGVLDAHDPTRISQDCRTDLLRFADGVNDGTDWAWGMADAWGSPRAGYFRGDGVWEGSFEECELISTTDKKGKIDGLLCMNTWTNNALKRKEGIGTCLPKTCNQAEVSTFLITGSLIKKLSLPGGFPPTDYTKIKTHCAYPREDRDVTRDPSAMIAIVILTIFGLLVLIGTTFDVVTNLRGRKTEEEKKTKRNSTELARSKQILVEDGAAGSGLDHPTEDGKDDVRPPAENGPVQSLDNPELATNVAKRPNKCVEFLYAFSFYRHVPSLLSFDHPRGSVTCLNGIRFLSFAWIVLGHTFELGIDFRVTETVANLPFKQELDKSMNGRVISNMNVAVEAFFVLSAFLTTVSFLKKMAGLKKPTCRMMSLYYFHRYWRLTPVYAMILMFYGCLFKYLGEGPFYPPYVPGAELCKEVWWRNILYLNNLFYDKGICMGWSWYLANDFQFYLVSPIFLLAYCYKPVLGIVLNVLAICGSLIIRFALYSTRYLGEEDEWFFWIRIYFAPWCRASTYFMGMLLGYFMWKRDLKPLKMKRWVAILLWCIIFAVGSGMVFANGSCLVCRIIYDSLLSPSTGGLVVWVIFACVTGNAGFINTILSWNGWLPLGRLTYVGYLIHPIVIFFTYYNNKVQLYMTTWTMMYMFFGNILLTLGISFVVSVCLEVPFRAIEMVIIPTNKPTVKKTSTQTPVDPKRSTNL